MNIGLKLEDDEPADKGDYSDPTSNKDLQGKPSLSTIQDTLVDDPSVTPANSNPNQSLPSLNP
jgi:hypothetical protein